MRGFWVTKAVGTALRAGFNAAGLAEACLNRLAGDRNRFPLWKDWQLRSLPPVKLPKIARPDILQHYPFTKYDTTGYYTLTMLASPQPRKLVAACLPLGLELCPCDTDPNSHPVFYTLGYQQDVRPIRGRFPLDYLEVIVGIPCVRLKSPGNLYPGPFIYMPSLYLNHMYPILLGRAIGYPKHWTRVTTTFNTIDVRGILSNQLILNAAFTQIGEVGSMKTYPDVSKVIGRLQQPLISDLLGFHIYTFLDWRFEFSRMQPVETSLTTAVNVPTLPRGTYTWKGVESADRWACRIFVPWDIVFPFGRSVLKSTEPCPEPNCPLYPKPAAV